MSKEVKKKKTFKKMTKNEPSISDINGSFLSPSMKDPDVSSISIGSQHTASKLESQGLRSILPEQVSISLIKKERQGSAVVVANLHHNGDFADLKGLFEDRQELKSLKKYIKKAFPATSIELFYGKRAPILKFQYCDTSKDKELRVRSLWDLLKANKAVGERQYETIQKIFDQIYCRTGEKDRKIPTFLNRLAEKKRVQLMLVDEKRKQPLLYYEYDEKKINFTLFDLKMRVLEFDSHIIHEYKFAAEEEKIWNGFIKNIQSKRSAQEQKFDEYNDLEVSSDQQRRDYGNIDLKEVRKNTKQILATDLSQYKNELQELDAQCSSLRDNNDDRDRPEIERLADKVFELHHNIDNFEQALRYVQQQLEQGKHLTPLKQQNLLKILIIAQKQLRSQLPIVARKHDIFRLLDKQDLIILQGETGSGKSTQLPQMMCEYLKMFEDQGKRVLPVLITQPRRLATRTVAERVAYEMQQKLGKFVDYSTSSHKKVSPSARIVFKLDTVVLDELTIDKTLSNYSCLIIDQAHQRTISIDVILGLVKELHQIRKGFKVIVTSASLDAQLFEVYFHSKVFKVSGRLFPVDAIYSPLSQEPNLVKKIQKVLKNQILIGNSQMREEYKGDVLVFCAGVDDINFLCSIFEKYLNHRVFRVFALHGKIAVTDQKEVFYQTKQHKIIFASRIAETSITINGVTVVIDPGVDRELVYDQKYRVSSRKLVNISQSSAKQRAGRAGRTSRGFCFRLYSQLQLRKFRPNKTPQIDNMALDTLVLRLKSLNVNNLLTFPYVKVPEAKALQLSVQTLKMIGGLSPKQEITTIGRLLIKLHVEPFLGRSIVEAIVCESIVRDTKFMSNQWSFKSWQKKQLDHLRNLKSYVIQILCMVMNSSNLFYGNIDLRDRIEEIKYSNFSNRKGDFFYLSNIYSQFFHRLKGNKESLDHWIRSNYLTKKTLYQVKDLIEQINQIIKNFKLDLKDPAITYLVDTIKLKMTYCKSVDDAILSCMVTSFCINLCLYSNNSRVGYTLVLQKKPVTIYGTSTLAQQGQTPKWIVCYDLKTNDKGVTYCTIAHQVNFDFLKRTVEDFVFERLRLRDAQKMNPFYQQIDRVLPSSVLAAIKKEYLDNQNHTFPLLHHLTLDFVQETNTLSVFYSKELKPNDVFKQADSWKLNIYQLVVNYIEQKKLASKKGKFIFNVVSNIFAQFTDGFIIKQINFADVEVQFVVKGERFVLGQIRNSLDGIYAYPFGQMLKVVTFGEGDEKRVRQILDGYDLLYDVQKRQKKEETLMGTIYMRFYTGRLKSSEPMLLHYGKNQSQKTRDMASILDQFISKQANLPTKCPDQIKRHLKLVSECKFKMAFKSAVIKCYSKTGTDAFELRQALQNLIITGVMPYQFQKPHSIREFRTYESSVVETRSEKEWEVLIKKIFEANSLKGLEVKVKGEGRNDDDPELNNAERMVNHQLTAVVTSKSLQAIDDMVRKFDGKAGLIGMGKIHFRYNFKQMVAKVNKRTFSALRDPYEHIKRMYEGQYQVKIQTFQKRFGKVAYIFINCRSPIRENLLKPTEELKDLFYPYIKRLTVTQFNFLQGTQQGSNQMEYIEDNFNKELYFGFIKRTCHIKIYCDQEDIEKVEREIDNIFQRHQVFVQNIPYRGKGLAKVEEVLRKLIEHNQKYLKKNNKSKLVLYYSINFKRREVQIYGDAQSIQEAKNEIKKLDNIKLGSCDLCGKDSQKPFKLAYCEHEFCEKCLGDYVKQVKKEQDDRSSVSISTVNSAVDVEAIPLVCPRDTCGLKINASDLQILLSTEEFQSLSMKRLKDFVRGNKQYFFCPTAGCQQIFQLKKVQERYSFECVMCGRWFCSRCKQPHQHFTCDEWKTKLEKGQLMRFGFKQCQCGYVIQKDNKEKIVRCKNCREYLCWGCKKSWTVEKHCLQHVRTCKQ